MEVLATEFSVMSSRPYGPIAPWTCWHIPGTKPAVFGSLLIYISVLVTQITFSYPNPLFSLNSLSIVLGIRNWFSFQLKRATLTQNWGVHKSVRLKQYSIEEVKYSGIKKEQIQYFQVGHITNFRFPPNLIISPHIWYFSKWKKINLETNQPCCLQLESTKFVV